LESQTPILNNFHFFPKPNEDRWTWRGAERKTI
jgi:hypothetical protein